MIVLVCLNKTCTDRLQRRVTQQVSEREEQCRVHRTEVVLQGVALVDFIRL